MSWVAPWSRYGDWLKTGEVGDEEHLINGLTCTAEIRSLAICCPACGAPYVIKASDHQSRVFDRPRLRRRCARCRFAASVHVIVDVTAHPYEPKRDQVAGDQGIVTSAPLCTPPASSGAGYVLCSLERRPDRLVRFSQTSFGSGLPVSAVPTVSRGTP